MTCPVCAEPIAPGAERCAACGAPLRGLRQARTIIQGAPVLEIRGPAGFRTVSLSGTRHRVGRHPDNDIVLTDSVVSRHHIVLERADGGFRLRDEGSTNGTFLNGERIADLLLVGPTELTLGPNEDDRVTLIYRPAPNLTDEPAQFESVSLAGRRSVRIGRDPGAELSLFDPLCSRVHAVVEPGATGGWAIRDLKSANGTFVNGTAVSMATLTPGSLIQVGSTRILFSGEQLVANPVGRGMRVDARDLVTALPDGKVLLDRVSVAVAPGELVAVLGVSGSGKSTLLGSLTGIRPATGGELRLDGVEIDAHRDAFRRAIGYVPQQDIIHRELTAEGALRYAARLRMPPDSTADELDRQVDQVLEHVGLLEHRATPIARLSGGQQKRVSVAVELLTRPPMLLLDEPTSGLDPGLDKQMMQLLARLADDGQTVLVVTHSVLNIDLCDKVMFLARGGRLAFFGSPKEARAYFKTDDFAEIYRLVEAEKTPAVWHDEFRASSAFAENVTRRQRTIPRRSESVAGAPVKVPPGASGWQQLVILSRRYAEIMARDRGNLVLLLVQAPIVALMLLVVVKSDAVVNPSLDAHKLVLMLACAAVWFGLINSVREIVKEAPIYERERKVGVGIAAYIGSKLVVLVALSLVQIGMLMAIVAWAVELPGKGTLIGMSLEMLVTLILTALVGVGLGLALSSVTTSPNRALSLTPWLLIAQVIFAGVVFELKGAVYPISWIVATRPAAEALVATIKMPFDAFGQPIDVSTRGSGYVLVRWGVLALLSIVGVGLTVASLRARDRVRRRPG